MPRLNSSKYLLLSYFYFLVVFCMKLGYIHGEQINTSCDYKFSKGGKTKNVTVTGNIQSASSRGLITYFNLCESVPPEYCGENVQLCVKRISDGSVLLSGYEFAPAYLNSSITLKKDSFYLKKLAAPYCDKRKQRSQILVRFECEDDSTDEPKLVVIEDCIFEIVLIHPTCIPQCTTRIHNHLVDLRPLRNVYHIYDDIGNFSIGLCTSNPECEISNSIGCLITKNETIPLSGDLESLQYYEENNIMKIRGKYKGQRKALDKILEIQIKCDWSRAEPLIYFLKTPNQFKTYHFEMLTSYACLKIPFSSKISHEPFIFDFEWLHKNNNYWKILLPNNEEILLNIFGPLVLLDEENNCSKTNSQICLKNGSEYINLGSIHTPPKINNDIISIKYTSGTTCHESKQQPPYEQYETYINFICGKDLGQPQLVKKESCITHLAWQTPSACPKYDKSTCRNVVKPSDQICLFNFDNHVFNLTNLYNKNGKYIIEDEQLNETEYILNVCGPVHDDDVPCNDKNVIYLRHKDEPNVEKRLVRLGKMKNFYYQDNQLILEMTEGALCNPHDYQSRIYFECSDKEYQPKLKSKSDCLFEFIWKTPAACPTVKKIMDDSGCIFKDDSASKIIDLTRLQREHYFLKMNMFGTTYVFDICSTYKENCSSKDGCVHISAKKHLLTYGSKMFVEFLLNKTCTSSSNFNRTLMELECDHIENNDHFNKPTIADCVLRYKLFTHLACENKDSSLYLYDIAKENNTVSEKLNENVRMKCYIINPRNRYSFDLMDLNLNFITEKCPTYTFHHTKNYTELTYDTDRRCDDSGIGKMYRYSVLLKCSEQSLYDVQKQNCQEIHTYGLSEYCKLLADPKINSGSMNWLTITGIVIAVLFGMAATIILILRTKNFCKRRLYRGLPLNFSYNKDGDL